MFRGGLAAVLMCCLAAWLLIQILHRREPRNIDIDIGTRSRYLVQLRDKMVKCEIQCCIRQSPIYFALPSFRSQAMSVQASRRKVLVFCSSWVPIGGLGAPSTSASVCTLYGSTEVVHEHPLLRISLMLREAPPYASTSLRESVFLNTLASSPGFFSLSAPTSS